MRAAHPTPAAEPGVPEEGAGTSEVEKARGLGLLLVLIAGCVLALRLAA
jgi:hypothetical protein